MCLLYFSLIMMVLLVEWNKVPEENHRLSASHWQIWSHKGCIEYTLPLTGINLPWSYDWRPPLPWLYDWRPPLPWSYDCLIYIYLYIQSLSALNLESWFQLMVGCTQYNPYVILSYQTTTTKSHLSYQTGFRLCWGSKILLNCPSQVGQPQL
jgi:hypothetical protein